MQGDWQFFLNTLSSHFTPDTHNKTWLLIKLKFSGNAVCRMFFPYLFSLIQTYNLHMKKTLLLLLALFVSSVAFSVPWKLTEKKLTAEEAGVIIEKIQNESFQAVLPANIVANRVYAEMGKEGFTIGEIVRLTDEYLTAHKAQLKQQGSNIDYAKFWRPYYVNSNLMNATIDDDLEELNKVKLNLEATQADIHAYNPRIFYTVNDRLAGIRNPGYFRQNAIMPAGGRIYWMTVHPDDPDKIMVNPDADGIWRTDDMGKTWDCITERIPNRYDRNHADTYSIPVDPDNWDHVYAFMNNNTVYKTLDGGQTWSKVAGATHKGFKRGYCFRDAEGKLKFIGAKLPVAGNNGVGAQLWISSDTCKNWSSIKATSAQMDITQNGTKTFWFQEIAFHPTDRNIVYITGSRRILRSTDGGKTFSNMSFKVYGATTATVRAESTDLFPLATANTPMFLAINPNNGNEMWAALSTRSNAGYSAVYKTTDGGQTWITVQEPSAGIGSGGVFGNESAWNWLGGFNVNFLDQRYVYGCSMSSAESTNGGVNFTEKPWTDRMPGFYPDGKIYTVSAASHNADNHVIKGHKTGRIYRGGDAGIYVKDDAINGGKWVNISGNMGQMLFYSSTTNEFGDYAIAGNTQDINIEFYRGGRWGQSRGYEGSTIWMNPFSGEEHYPYITSEGVMIQNQDYGSWSRAWTAADVCTGNWYIRREGTNSDGSRFSVVKNFGKSSKAIDNASTGWVQDFALSRDVPGGKLFIIRNNRLFYSTNSGATFTQISTGSYSPTKVAVNPNNSNEIYMARDGVVYMTVNGGTNWSVISTSTLTGMQVSRLLYHEGSGDLYYVSGVHGIFIREAGTTDWVLWQKGYNTAKLGDAYINYTTQEMIITDYGSGIWVADLQHPADRYLSEGFALKQFSNINQTRTFGVDVHFSIPLYYYYKWYVNGVLQTKENGQFFSTSSLLPNDKVKLEVTLRESPDITTRSAEFTVPDESSTTIENTRGNYLYSNQKGSVDLGYADHFFGNFSLQMWVNPKSDGVILANRQVNTSSVKGFYLSITGGRIKFTYTPENNFLQPFNETTKTIHYTLDGGGLSLNTWSHITITHNRTGNIQLYVNGVLKATQVRAMPAFTLNNSLYLSLFADGYELNPLDGAVDELKIWSDVLDPTTIRKSMHADVTPQDKKLIYYNDFNAATAEELKERFSQKAIGPRTEAKVTLNESALGVCASDNEYKAIGTDWTPFANKGTTAMEIKSVAAGYAPNVLGLFYNGSFLGTKTSLMPAYYNVYPIAFGVKMFDVTDFTKLVDVKFHLDPTTADNYAAAKIYTLDLNANLESWSRFAATPVYNPADKTITLTGVKASDINNKQLVVVKENAAMELTSGTIVSGAELNVYSPEKLSVPLQASLIGGMAPPAGSYNLTASSSVVTGIDPLNFTGNTATTTAYIALEDNDRMNETTPVTITGQDASLKPFEFTVVNKISSKTIQNGIKMNLGGAVVGSGSNFAALNGKNTATYMTWVRLDDATMLTGYKMLLFFRGTGTNASGLVLKDGKIGCHWNDENWSWDVNSGLTLTTADVGKWVHIAMTASSTGLEFYLNGKKGIRISRTINTATIGSGLMLGKNQPGDAVFIGAFDQVALWNRTLTPQEIVKYMHSRTYLNDAGLVSYITFDKEETGGGFLDLKSNASVAFDGVVQTNQVSNIPFNFAAQQSRTRTANNGVMTDSIGFTLPAAYPAANVYYTSRFTGVPFNSIDVKYPKQVPLEDSYRTITFGAIRPFTPAEKIQFTIENPAIADGDSVIFYARSLGSVGAFTTRISVLAASGKANFDVAATIFNENLTYMFYRLPKVPNAVENTAEYRYKLTVDNGLCTIHNLRGNARIYFYDLNGKVIVSEQTHETLFRVKLPKGIYILRIEENGVPGMIKIMI